MNRVRASSNTRRGSADNCLRLSRASTRSIRRLLEAALVTLVDVPLVQASTVAAVIEAWRRTRAPIVRPAEGERHGHPVIFDRSVFADLRSADLNTGAKAVFALHRDRIVNVEVNDDGAFEDIDTPEDYERMS